MSSLRKGLLIAGVQILIVLSLGAKLLIDRARFPRVWVQTAAYDPDDPFRGRYLTVRLRVQADRMYKGEPLPSGRNTNPWLQLKPVYLTAEDGQLFANPASEWTRLQVTRWNTPQGEIDVLQEPVDYFIPETAKDPSQREPGEELWIEVTVPKKGPPRPIRLGVKKNGTLTPLPIQ